MNRYPVWKYVIIVIAMLVGSLYTLPNLFGESPAVQVSSGKATIKVDTSTLQKVEDVLKAAGTTPQSLALEGASIRARFESRFAEPNLHAQLVKRMVCGATVIDQEIVTRTFPEGAGRIELVAIYEVQNGRITRAWFISGDKTLD